MILTLMYKTLSFYWFVTLFSFICNLEKVFAKETIPIQLNFKGKYTSDINNFEIVVPQRVNQDGTFISHLVSHRHSKRSTEDLEYIFYKIPIAGKDYLIELTPNRKLISPGAVIEIHNGNVSKPEKRQFLNESSSSENIGRMFKDLNIRKLENTDCYFSGTVKGENISKAALSTCYGLAGFIQIKEGFYTIEPVAEHNPFLEDAYPHILYKADGLENSSACHALREITETLIRKRRENIGLSLPKYLETLIVMDKTLIDHHGNSECENYVLTVFNMAFNLFHDASSGLMMTLTVVRLIRLEVENDEMNLEVNEDAEKTLRYFQTWQYEINPGDDSHPNHHDIAILITRVNVCYSPSSCGLLGLTTIGKACDPKLSAALCEDNGLRLGYVIAHEIGHLLGADHDTGNSSCNGTDGNGLKTVMHPHVSLSSQTWSTCSRAYFKEFFSSGMGKCLVDEPEEHHFNVQDLLPGVMYNADYQCKHLITNAARECEMGSTCDSLNCYVPGYACVVTHKPPADGTRCGENMWCHDNKCLIVGERPGAVDGSWGEWSAWSECSRTCGAGVANSERNCDKPQPSNGGRNCIGERKRYKICAATPCETGRPSFRDIQCGEFNDWIYPEDGKVHTWVAYFFHDGKSVIPLPGAENQGSLLSASILLLLDNPCTLYCINEEKEVAAFRPRVVDGTMCFRGIRDICVGGICKSLPCDLHFESNAIEDACGICHGDGTGCEFSEGTETFSQLNKGLTKLVNIPSGTRNIKVEELSPTLAKIIVKDKDTKEIYVRGKSLGMFSVPGSQAWLGMIKKNQEALNIPGPVTKPLSIWIHRLDNVSLKWSMALPAEQQRKPEFGWDYLRWGPCSAKCGLGTQMSKPNCIEGKSGLVEDSFCAELEAPPTKVRQCEVTECRPKWMVGDWKGCDELTLQKKERRRVVYCIKPIGEGEGESEIVPDSECLEPKPHESEPCERRRKREDNEYNVEPFYNPDTSEFGFHKKYDDYLKHFAALSVPQRNSETIPLHLVSSPHFKHYFRVLEDSQSDLTSETDLNAPDGSSYESENKVAPSFYKETFSGEQIGVSHIQPVFEENTNFLQNRTKKSVDSRRRRNATQFKRLNQQKLSNKRRLRFKKYPKMGTRDARHGCWKNFNYTSSNLMTVVESLNEIDKVRFAKLLNNERPAETSSFNSEKLKQFNWIPKKLSEKKNNFFSLFSKKKSKSNEKPNVELPRIIQNHQKGYDGSGLRKFPQTGEKILEEGQKWGKDDKIACGNPFDPTSTGRFNHHFKDKHAFDDLPRRNKRYEPKKKNYKRTTTLKKKSSRIWKKPKSGEACGTETKNYLNNLFRDSHPKNVSPKPTVTSEPQEVKRTIERPNIREGVVVVDKDSSEDQEMEIVFEGDEAEGARHEYLELPQPTENEKSLRIKGQDVFYVLQKLQELQKRPSRKAFCRFRPTEKLENNIKIPENGKIQNNTTPTTISTVSDVTKFEETNTTETSTTKHTKNDKQAEEIAKSCSPSSEKKPEETEKSSTSGGKKPEETEKSSTWGGKKPEETSKSSTWGGKKPEETEKSSTSGGKKPEETSKSSTWGGKKPEETEKSSTSGDKNLTVVENLEQTVEKTDNDQSEDDEYDLDEVITENSNSTSELSRADKKKKKKYDKEKEKEMDKKEKEEKKKKKKGHGKKKKKKKTKVAVYNYR